MTKTLIGLDHTGTACVKITKGSYDPVTTPDGDIAKFLYSSKWAADFKIAALFRGLSEDAGYYPSEANWTYAVPQNKVVNTNETYYDQPTVIKKGYFSGLIYDYPLHLRKQYDANGFDITNRIWSFSLSGYNTTYVWQAANASPNNVGWLNAGAQVRMATNSSGYITFQPSQTFTTNKAYSPYNSRISMPVFNLSGDDTAIQNGDERAPIAGQAQILINSTTLKVSKPGFDVYSASGTQVAFDSANMPGKIIAANDIEIPAGTSYYNVGYDLSIEVFIECHFYRGSEIYYPANPNVKETFYVGFRKNGTYIEFSNTGDACRARFLVFASGATDQTYGSNDVLRQFTDGNGNNVVQFLRPGAGANPSFSDIVIDSRWPVVKIIKNGYFSINDGAAQTTINYDASGMFCFVLWNTVHGPATLNGGQSYQWNWDKFVRPPEFNAWAINNGGINIGGNSSIARYNNTSVTFYTYRSIPKYIRYPTSTPVNVNDVATMLGVRYYVLGVAIP